MSIKSTSQRFLLHADWIKESKTAPIALKASKVKIPLVSYMKPTTTTLWTGKFYECICCWHLPPPKTNMCELYHFDILGVYNSIYGGRLCSNGLLTTQKLNLPFSYFLGAILSFCGAIFLAKVQYLINNEFSSLACKLEYIPCFWSKFINYWFHEQVMLGTILIFIGIAIGLFFILSIHAKTTSKDKRENRMEILEDREIRALQHRELIEAIRDLSKKDKK